MHKSNNKKILKVKLKEAKGRTRKWSKDEKVKFPVISAYDIYEKETKGER